MSTASGNADVYTLPFAAGLDATPRRRARNLTHDPGGDFRPDFSPDGSKIAFSSDRDTPVYGHPIFSFTRQREGELYVMGSDGSDARRLTTSADWDGSPEWSADGATIYFYSGAAARAAGPADEPDPGPRRRLSNLGDRGGRHEPARAHATRRRGARAGRDAGRADRVSNARRLRGLEHPIDRGRTAATPRNETDPADALLAARLRRARRDGVPRRRTDEHRNAGGRGDSRRRRAARGRLSRARRAARSGA